MQQTMPDRLVVNGRGYVAEDTLAPTREPASVEPSYTVAELSEMSRFPASTIYDNVRAGNIRYVHVNGTRRGMRIMLSEWERFLAERLR